MPCFFAQLQNCTWLLAVRGMSEESRPSSPPNGQLSRFEQSLPLRLAQLADQTRREGFDRLQSLVQLQLVHET